jgi:uncharacterized protein
MTLTVDTAKTATTARTSLASTATDSAEGVTAASVRPPLSRRGALFLLRAYQGAASGRVSMCRYYPSCSNYAVEAFTEHRFWRAFGLTARRLLRCRPFGPHGIDLVPLNHSHGDHTAAQVAHPEIAEESTRP